jgi:hypothetical protein
VGAAAGVQAAKEAPAVAQAAYFKKSLRDICWCFMVVSFLI